MKSKILSFIALGAILLVFSCSKQDLFLENDSLCNSIEVNLDEVYYYEEAGIYLSKIDLAEIIPTKTSSEKSKRYYAARFFPKNTEELLCLRNLEDVTVSYIPWGYTPVSDAALSKDNQISIKTYQADKENPHFIESVVRGDTLVVRLPVLYAFWPEEISFPDVDYEIIDSFDIPLRDPEPSNRYTLTLRTFDSLLGTYVPVKNIKVDFILGTFYVSLTTDAQGTVQITPSAYINPPSNVSNVAVYVLPETDCFTVSRLNDNNNSVVAIVDVLGTLGSIFGTPGQSNPSETITLSSTTTEYEIFRAAEYYNKESHYLSNNIATTESGVLFLAHDNPAPNSNVLGETDVTTKHVHIYNAGLNMQDLIANTLHEVGHIRHYEKSHYTYSRSDSLVIESYASFVGWILGEQYYTSKGYVKPYHSYQINNEGRQGWVKTWTTPDYYYSPLFVDLWDNYNQSADYYYGIPESIAWIPINVIEGMTSCESLNECLSYIQGYIGQYYLTQNDYNTLLNYYL